MSAQGYYNQGGYGQPQYPPQSYGGPYQQGPPVRLPSFPVVLAALFVWVLRLLLTLADRRGSQMQYQQQAPPQPVIVERRQKDRGCLGGW